MTVMPSQSRLRIGVLPNAVQIFILTVTQAPTFISPASATFATSVPGSFNVETRANPVASRQKPARSRAA